MNWVNKMRVAGIGLVTAILAACSSTQGYDVDRNKPVYRFMYVDPGVSAHQVSRELGAVDRASFENLMDENGQPTRFAKDRFTVWYAGQVIDGADAASFERLYGHYSRDRSAVYYFEKKVTDIASDETVKAPPYLTNDSKYLAIGNDLYEYGRLVPTVDALTAEPVPGRYEYLKDKHGVFLFFRPADKVGHPPRRLDVCDLQTWESVSWYLSRDKDCAYYYDLTIYGADPDTIRAIHFHTPRNVYLADRNAVFYANIYTAEVIRLQDVSPEQVETSPDRFEFGDGEICYRAARPYSCDTPWSKTDANIP